MARKKNRAGCEALGKSSCDEKFLCRWDKEDRVCKTNPVFPLFLILGAGTIAALIITKKSQPTTGHYQCTHGNCVHLPGPGPSFATCRSYCTNPNLCRDPGANNYLKNLPCVYSGNICLDPLARNYKQPLPCIYETFPVP